MSTQRSPATSGPGIGGGLGAGTSGVGVAVGSGVGVGVGVAVAVAVLVAVGVAVGVGVGVAVGFGAKTFHPALGPYWCSENPTAVSPATTSASAAATAVIRRRSMGGRAFRTARVSGVQTREAAARLTAGAGFALDDKRRGRPPGRPRSIDQPEGCAT